MNNWSDGWTTTTNLVTTFCCINCFLACFLINRNIYNQFEATIQEKENCQQSDTHFHVETRITQKLEFDILWQCLLHNELSTTVLFQEQPVSFSRKFCLNLDSVIRLAFTNNILWQRCTYTCTLCVLEKTNNLIIINANNIENNRSIIFYFP